MKKNEVKRFKEFSETDEKIKEINKEITTLSNARDEKKHLAKEDTIKIQKLRRRLNNLKKSLSHHE